MIDVGIGLERIPWLINGSATSYMDTFKNSITYFLDKIDLELNIEVRAMRVTKLFYVYIEPCGQNLNRKFYLSCC